MRPPVRMRSKAMLMVIIIMSVMLIVLTMFIKNITEPLQHMIRVSEKISSGDLRQTIRIDARNELSHLGMVINEMASNLQEITMLSKRMCAGGHNFVQNAVNDRVLKEMFVFLLTLIGIHLIYNSY
jgi:nitrogen fixation/metabolism regulation signal transduction histidine kinase